SDHISFFFLPSRRRHTSATRDWNSDVCSSDLLNREGTVVRAGLDQLHCLATADEQGAGIDEIAGGHAETAEFADGQAEGQIRVQIGRAWCGDRGWRWGGGGVGGTECMIEWRCV